MVTKTDKITFHLISHTHWDREWYLPFEVFRIELVELIDNLLDILEQNNDFIFHLDGQSIILQDYLEIKPHKKEQIRKFVQSGNLLIGPWYVLSDQFLTSGEALIRNLLYGIRDTKDFGDVMLVGYLVDQFGQVAQLPQIFKGFNIHSAIIGRGIQDSTAEHTWYGLNGDSVIAISLTHWYNNAQRLPSEKEKLTKYLNKIYETQSCTSHSGHILLMNGCDHLTVQSNLPQILKSLNGKNGNEKWHLVQNALPLALRNIIEHKEKENYPICFGELRDDNNKYILAGTLSSRVYLKLANYQCQTRLEKIVEPLAVFLNLNSKIVYPYEQIKYAWRLLMQNHAHDSVCGCSIDDVHKEMEMRFLKVAQVLNKLKENLLLNLNDNRDTVSKHLYIQLFNLTSLHRNDIVEVNLEFPVGPLAEHPSASPTINKEEIKNILLKHSGEKIDLEILESKQTFKIVRSKDEVPLLQAVQQIKILFEINIQPCSIQTYEIETVEMLCHSASAKTTIFDFENKNYKLKVNKDGTISIALRENNKIFENIHYLTTEDDLGDEYNFVPNSKSQTISSVNYNWNIKITEENKFRKRFLLTTEDFLGLELQSEIACYKNSNRIDFKTKANNHCKNKRIRLHFPTMLNTNYLTSDTPFGILERAHPPIDWVNYANTQPLHNWIDHSNNEVGLAFFGGGLADYELYEDGNGFAITLIRAVGKLSTMKSHSLIQTPEAQCNREIEFQYAIYPHLNNWQGANIQNEQLIYQTPIITNQSNQKLELSNLINASPHLVISSLKRSEDKENLYIVRLFNPYNKTLENCKLSLSFSAKKLYLLNMNEEITSTIKGSNNCVTFEAKPLQVLTFGVEI